MPDEEKGNSENGIEIPTKERANLSDAFYLGVYVQWLKSQIHVGDLTQESLIDTLEEIEKRAIKFREGQILAGNAKDIREEVSEEIGSEEELDEVFLEKIDTVLIRWEQEISRILADEKIITIRGSGLFDVQSAMENPQNLLRVEIWAELPKRPRHDIKESCRALAAGCPTASVMLSLRAVEDRLRFWYKEKSGEEMNKAWGEVLGSLEEKVKNNPPILTNLDYLREKRNEVNHPEKSPTYQEAVTTLFMVRGTISEIHQEIDD